MPQRYKLPGELSERRFVRQPSRQLSEQLPQLNGAANIGLPLNRASMTTADTKSRQQLLEQLRQERLEQIKQQWGDDGARIRAEMEAAKRFNLLNTSEFNDRQKAQANAGTLMLRGIRPEIAMGVTGTTPYYGSYRDDYDPLSSARSVRTEQDAGYQHLHDYLAAQGALQPLDQRIAQSRAYGTRPIPGGGVEPNAPRLSEQDRVALHTQYPGATHFTYSGGVGGAWKPAGLPAPRYDQYGSLPSNPGITTKELDDRAKAVMAAHAARRQNRSELISGAANIGVLPQTSTAMSSPVGPVASPITRPPVGPIASPITRPPVGPVAGPITRPLATTPSVVTPSATRTYKLPQQLPARQRLLQQELASRKLQQHQSILARIEQQLLGQRRQQQELEQHKLEQERLRQLRTQQYEAGNIGLPLERTHNIEPIIAPPSFITPPVQQPLRQWVE